MRLWQLLAIVATATFAFGLGVGRYVVPKHEKSSLERALNGFAPGYERQSSESEAQADVRAAIPALEAWNADHGGYSGATLEALRTQYDAGIKDVTIVYVTAADYCIESSVGGATYHKQGPAAEILSGACPRT